MSTRKGKTLQVLNHLKEHGSITQLEAMTKYKSMRLSGIIYRLKHEDGYDIKTVIETDPNTKSQYAKYVWKGGEA